MNFSSIVNVRKDLLELILQCEQLSFKDVINFSSTCKDLYNFNAETVWKNKFFQRFPRAWPKLLDEYSSFIAKIQEATIDWKQEAKNSIKIRELVWEKLTGMSKNHFGKKLLPPNELPEFKALCDSAINPLMYLSIIDELLQILNDGKDQQNLTLKYYAQFLLRYIKQIYIMGKLRDYCSRPEKQVILEKMAIFVADWFQTESFMYESQVTSSLNDISDLVERALAQRNPLHPLFKVPTKIRKQWRTSNLHRQQFGSEETSQIIDCISDVLFDKLGFEIIESNDLNCVQNLEFSFINKALSSRKGTWRILWIIFESIARRLGVRCEVVKCSTGNELLFLGWKETHFKNKQRRTATEKRKYCPVKFLNKEFYKQLFNENFQCQSFVGSSMGANNIMISLCKVIMDGINKCYSRLSDDEIYRYVTSSLGLHRALVSSGDDEFYKDCSFGHSKFDVETVDFFYYLIDTGKLDLEKITFPVDALYLLDNYVVNDKSQDELKPKKRDDQVKFAVGQIVYEEELDEYFVITGWEKGADHTWYNVLCEDGNFDFICQGSDLDEQSIAFLGGASTKVYSVPIENNELGRYFTKFNGSFYVPNEELESIYPDDAKVRKKYLERKWKMILKKKTV